MKIFIHSRYLILYCAFLCFILLSIELIAQTEGTDNQKDTVTSYLLTEKRLPILNNFRFIPTETVMDPFITSFIKLNVGTGTAIDITSYVKDLEGNIRDTLSGDISYMSAELQFQFVVNNWLAFYAGAGGFGRVGTDTYTILTSGISYASGLTVGGKAKLWQNEKMMLSTSLDFKYLDIYVYSIYDFVKEVVEVGGIDSTSNIVESDIITNTFVNVNYAYAPSDWCGILAVGGFGLGEAFDGKAKGNIRLGAAFSVDFNNVKSIEFPIGILASAKFNTIGESGSATSDIFTYSFKLAYTGHKDFDIGIESTYQSLRYKASDEKLNTILTSFTLRYYF